MHIHDSGLCVQLEVSYNKIRKPSLLVDILELVGYSKWASPADVLVFLVRCLVLPDPVIEVYQLAELAVTELVLLLSKHKAKGNFDSGSKGD